MYTRKLITSILSVLIISLTISCKKKSNINLSTSKIATVNYSESGGIRKHYFITYDMYNNVDSIGMLGGGTDTGSNGYEKFTYVGSSFTITDQGNNSYTVDANTNGQILKILLIDSITMAYNGTQIVEVNYAYPSYDYTYLWDNNNDIAGFSLNGGVVDSYYYDLSHSGQEGDALRIDNFLQYGRSYISTSHVADELEYGGTWIEEYMYTYDNTGRISQLTKVINGGSSPNDTETYAYTYY